MRFSLKQALIGMAAIAALLSQWPPYFRDFDDTEPFGFNERFCAVVGIELAIYAWVRLTRWADSLRRELDNPPADSNQEP